MTGVQEDFFLTGVQEDLGQEYRRTFTGGQEDFGQEYRRTRGREIFRQEDGRTREWEDGRMGRKDGKEKRKYEKL